MEYITYKDFNKKAICGEVNLPKGTICSEINGVIYHNCKAVCFNKSENGIRHFARNDDGNGLKRGELIESIENTLSVNEECWEKVVNDSTCIQFNKCEDETWIWNYDFYHADIATLEYILQLITA